MAGLGGLQNWVCSLAEALARRGLEVKLMQPPWIDPAVEMYSELVHRWDLEKVCDFDVVYSHGCSGFKNCKIGKVVQVPFVHTYYGTILGIQIALRWFQNLVGWDGLSVPRNIVREVAGGQAAKAVIAIGPRVRAEIRKFCAIRKRKITVIPGGYSGDNNSASRQSLRRSLASSAK